ncbi:MAG: hypothetical protein DA408_12245 [Bacteroidetes bacterium]|nr:MAG: hypothetical protein C7N36_10325 [Bacteroidota bacterium]PTM12007.1 MAG: hypothetical protein DA408_12245 [Bacteroidota bacterium]
MKYTDKIASRLTSLLMLFILLPFSYLVTKSNEDLFEDLQSIDNQLLKKYYRHYGYILFASAGLFMISKILWLD